jgi:hypothetical protein
MHAPAGDIDDFAKAAAKAVRCGCCPASRRGALSLEECFGKK